MSKVLIDRLKSYIPSGDGHNSQYANDLADAVVLLESKAAPSAPKADDPVKDAARWDMLVQIYDHVLTHPDSRTHDAEYGRYKAAIEAGLGITGAIDAAMAGGWGVSEVKRYDQSEDSYGNSRGMKWSPYGDYVLASDYDQLKAENERLRNSLSEVTTRIARDQRTQKATDSTLDGYLAAGISAADAERDTLRTQLAEIGSALVAKNHEAHDLEIDNRQLRKQLDEARDLLTGWRAVGRSDGADAYDWAYKVDAWLKKNPA